MKKLFSFAVACFIASVGYAQGEVNTSLPQADIAKAAAHMPQLSKSDGSGEQITHGDISYSATSISDLENWVKTYPEEVNGYMNVVSLYMHDVQESEVPATEKEAYNDLKAQWRLIHELSTSEK